MPFKKYNKLVKTKLCHSFGYRTKEEKRPLFGVDIYRYNNAARGEWLEIFRRLDIRETLVLQLHLHYVCKRRILPLKGLNRKSEKLF